MIQKGEQVQCQPYWSEIALCSRSPLGVTSTATAHIPNFALPQGTVCGAWVLFTHKPTHTHIPCSAWLFWKC